MKKRFNDKFALYMAIRVVDYIWFDFLGMTDDFEDYNGVLLEDVHKIISKTIKEEMK